MPTITKFSFLLALCVTAAGVSACAGKPDAQTGNTLTQQTAQNGVQHRAQYRAQNGVQHRTQNRVSYAGIQRVAYTTTAPVVKTADKADSYGLNIGDKVKITTYGHADLSGEFRVESNGSINLPLVGNIKAVGKSQQQLENDIRRTLASGYLVDPKVSVEVANLRQFYIVGEVASPGAYDYVPSLNILKAVAIAGGFTRRAVTDEFVILRMAESGAEQKLDVSEESGVLPGDTIRVDERFF